MSVLATVANGAFDGALGPHYDPVSVSRDLALSLGLAGHYAGEEGLDETSRTIRFLDQGSDGQSGYGAVTDSTGVFLIRHTSQEFTELMRSVGVNKWAEGFRPSLPNLVAGILREEGIDIYSYETNPNLDDETKALIRASMLSALRAEYVRGEPRLPLTWQDANDYHNAAHNLQVASTAYYLADITSHQSNHTFEHIKKDGSVFSLKHKLNCLVCALSHDVDHPGFGNPANDRTYNERRSVDVMAPIWRAAGLSDELIMLNRSIIAATSPNGMIAGLKKALTMVSQENPEDVDFSALAKEYPELTPLFQGGLETAQLHLEMAAIVNDADLTVSAACGLEANAFQSKLLTKEAKAAGIDMNFESHGARMYFLENIVGTKGFGSRAGIEYFNPSFYALLSATASRMTLDEGHERFRMGLDAELVRRKSLGLENRGLHLTG